MTLRPTRPSLAWIALSAAAAVIPGACSRSAQDDACPPCPCAATSASSAAPPKLPNQKLTALEGETGKGELLIDKHVPEVWVPDVEVHHLAVHRSSLWWSERSGVYERPFDGEVRQVIQAPRVGALVADDGGVVVAIVMGPEENPDRFELQQIGADERAPRRLARMACVPRDLALARDFVVVASTCGIFAVPRKGGAPRQLEAETPHHVAVAADRDRVCYVNDHRLTCRSLVDTKERPRVLAALRPGPLLLDRLVLYALEEGMMADVPRHDDYGRLVRWEVEPTGERWVLTSKQYEASHLLRDDDAIYYGTGGGSVRRVSKNGEQVQTLYHVNRQETPRLAIGGGFLYFVLSSERGIRRFRLATE
ncbi:MAG TPA: hypothetical protein VE093_37735 [Polyangiaceae bacterium]|nr:hypothetical protein [Polyangiaceae bacterium]